MNWSFGDLKPLSYDVVIVDPPSRFETFSEAGEEKSPQAQYDTMGQEEILALPVAELLRGDGLCFVWTTWPLMVSGAAQQWMPAWGVRPVTGGAWFKRTRTDKPSFGTGYRLRSACEPFMIGTMGNPATAKNVRNVIETMEKENGVYAPVREHSRKPDDQYQLCERLCPRALHGAELFARQRYVGGAITWSAWGNQVEQFEQQALPKEGESLHQT